MYLAFSMFISLAHIIIFVEILSIDFVNFPSSVLGSLYSIYSSYCLSFSSDLAAASSASCSAVLRSAATVITSPTIVSHISWIASIWSTRPRSTSSVWSIYGWRYDAMIGRCPTWQISDSLTRSISKSISSHINSAKRLYFS